MASKVEAFFAIDRRSAHHHGCASGALWRENDSHSAGDDGYQDSENRRGDEDGWRCRPVDAGMNLAAYMITIDRSPKPKPRGAAQFSTSSSAAGLRERWILIR